MWFFGGPYVGLACRVCKGLLGLNRLAKPSVLNPKPETLNPKPGVLRFGAGGSGKPF